MKHHDLSSFVVAEYVEKAEPVAAETTNRDSLDPEQGTRLRTALRLAQDQRDSLRARRNRVSEAVERVNEMRAAFESELAQFSDFDVEIGERCAAMILRSIENSEELTLDLSPEFEKMSDQRFTLENRLTAARHAGERLRLELTKAESDLTEAENAVESAAVAVVAFEIEAIASELSKIEKRASLLRRLLLGYSAQRHRGGFLPMSPSAAQVLRGARGAHDPTIAALWRTYLRTLTVDSTAVFDGGSFS
jgi:chromosome segregation ATPase